MVSTPHRGFGEEAYYIWAEGVIHVIHSLRGFVKF